MQITINSIEEFNQYFYKAISNRKIEKTKANHSSSRSHFLIELKFHDVNNNWSSTGFLNFIVLAGSESIDNADDNKLFLEAININQSLLHLKRVILSIKSKEMYVLYKGFKLTENLKKSLDGNCKTLLILNISPLEESYCATIACLKFGEDVYSCQSAKM